MKQHTKEQLDRLAKARAEYHSFAAISYTEDTVDILGNGEIEIDDNGDIICWEHPKSLRTCFDKQRFDTLYWAKEDKWTKLIH